MHARHSDRLISMARWHQSLHTLRLRRHKARSIQGFRRPSRARRGQPFSMRKIAGEDGNDANAGNENRDR
jgi:hypothetical protein